MRARVRRRGARGRQRGRGRPARPAAADVAQTARRRPTATVQAVAARRSARSAGTASTRASTTSLDTAPISEITFKVPWEELERGPVGEYLEVIDVDPASGCFYEPVDLDDPQRAWRRDGLRAERGHAAVPSADGLRGGEPDDPQLRARARPPHACGGRAAADPRADPKDDSDFVPRLRVYPHALREANAYYSPQRSRCCSATSRPSATTPRDHVPGGMVFTLPVARHRRARDHARAARRHAPPLPEADQPRRPRLSRRLRRHRRAVSALHVSGRSCGTRSPARAAICATRRTCWASWPVSSAAPPGMRGALRDAIGDDRSGDEDLAAARARSGRVRRHARAARARRHSRRRGVRRVSRHLRAPRSADLLRLATGGTGVLQPGAHPSRTSSRGSPPRRPSPRSTC